jgi:hypothetical protein
MYNNSEFIMGIRDGRFVIPAKAGKVPSGESNDKDLEEERL